MLMYLCEVYRLVTDDGPEYRPAVADYPVSWQASIPGDPQTGVPLNDWCRVEVTGATVGQLAAISQDARIDALPDYPLTTPMAQIAAGAVQSLRAALARHGIDSAVVDASETYGAVIEAIDLCANTAGKMPLLNQAVL